MYILPERTPMIDKRRTTIPHDHPIHAVFRQLTERGMSQLPLRDKDTIQYVTNLLTEFVHIENMYCVKDKSGRELDYMCDILDQASQAMSPDVRREYYRH